MSRSSSVGALLAFALSGSLVACADESLPSDPPPANEPDAQAACRADAGSFVLRTMPTLHGRRPLGIAEVRLLAGLIDQLEARGRDGRRQVAAALADGDDYRRRWGSELYDLLRVRRAGHRALVRCHGERGPAAESTALAEWVGEHPPTEPFAGGPWSMRDLVESSLRADDLRPVLRADLLVRMVAPIDDANTSPDDLERARRTNLGRSFEATYLGRRFECLSCHRDDASVTDHAEPALDRFWPVAQGLEAAVYPEAEDSLHAVFRYEGVADGEQPPWGAQGCGGFSLDPNLDEDRMGIPAQLAGPMPAGASVLDLQARLDRGLERLAIGGWSSRPRDESEALAQLVVLHVVDGLWARVTGQPLTLDHGTPRNQEQAARLRSLATTLVDSQYSIRAVLVEIAVDSAVDRSVPAACEAQAPETLPAIFDPFAQPDASAGPGANGIGHAVHRRDPFALYDEAHRVLGRALPGPVTGQPGFDSTRLGALGAYLRDSQPGHDGLDLLGALSWEDALEVLPSEPEPEPEATDEPTITLDDLVRAGRADPQITVGDLMVAIKDRIFADPTIDPDERALVESLVELPWELSLSTLAEPTVHEAALRYARVLMASPQFLLSGLANASEGEPPRLTLDDVRPVNLCRHWGPRLLPDEPWWCTDDGVVLP